MGAFVQLFPDPAPAPRPVDKMRSPAPRRLGWLGRAVARRDADRGPITLPAAMAVSFAAHACVIGLLALRGAGVGRPAAAPARDLGLFSEAVQALLQEEPGALLAGLDIAPGETASPEDLRLFARAIHELIGEQTGSGETPAMPVPRPSDADPLTDLSIAFGAGLSDRDKVEVFKQLLRSDAEPGAPAGGMSGGVRLGSGDRVFLGGSAAGGGRLEVHRLEKADADVLEALKSSGDYVSKPPANAEGTVRLGTGVRVRDAPAEYFYRACPYERILARGADLFTLAKGFPELPLEPPAAGETPDGAAAHAGTAAPARFFARLLRTAPRFAPWKGGTGEGALPAAGEVDRVLDGLMAHPEDVQFGRFERAYLEPGDLEDENLARLTGEFLFRNVNGAFFAVDRLTSAFDALEDLYYRRAVFDRLAGWIRRAPRSRVAAELLFYLASSYDYEKRVILHLAAALEEAEGVMAGTVSTPSIFNPRVKAYTVKAVYDELRGRLSAAGCSSVDDAVGRYTAAQDRIYGELQSRSGETRNRALFAAGRLRWEEGDVKSALALWLRIPVTTGIESAHRIRRALDSATPFRLPERVAVDRIDKVLADDSFRNSARLHERAIRFGKWSVRSGAQPPEKSGGRTPGRPAGARPDIVIGGGEAAVTR